MSGVHQPLSPRAVTFRAEAFRPCAVRDLTATGGAGSLPDATEPAQAPQTRQVRLELGRRTLTLAEVGQLGRGSVVRLQERQGDPVNIYAEELLLARGQLLLQDGCLGVRITELVTGPGDRESLPDVAPGTSVSP